MEQKRLSGLGARLSSRVADLAPARSDSLICYLAAKQLVRRALGSGGSARGSVACHLGAVGRYEFRFAGNGLSLRRGRRWAATPKQLPPIYRTWKHGLFALRTETIELLFQRIMQAVGLKDCPRKGLRRNGAFVISSVWHYQVITWSNYKQGKPIAEVKETIDLARWRVAA